MFGFALSAFTYLVWGKGDFLYGCIWFAQCLILQNEDR